jgi:predicted negative regulator of RcsB-dependent stress response
MAASRPSSAAVARLAARDVPAALERAWRLARHGAPETLVAFDEVWRAATARRDFSVAAQAAAAAICIIDADYRDFRSFDAWAARLAAAIAHPDPQDDPSASLLLLGARALCALHAAEVFDDGPGTGHVVSLLRRATDADKALLGAAALIVLLNSSRRGRESTQIEIEAESLAAAAGPWTAGHWRSIRGQQALFNHRLDEAEGLLQHALEHARRHELRPIAAMTNLMLARLALARGDDDAVAAYLAAAEPIADERDPMWRAVVEQIRSLAQLHAGHFSEALRSARLALAWAGKAAAPDAESIQMRCLEGYCLTAVHDGHGAAVAFQDASERGTRYQSRQARVFAGMATADALALDGRADEALPYLATAFAEVRALDYAAFFWPVPEVASRVCALALAAGVDTDYVRSIIRTRELAPPPDAPASWPWACRIDVLGGFHVEFDGKRLARDRVKTSSKPLELLRAIVALGGREVDVDHLVALLWPGKGRVGARTAFNVTLLRLRRLLRLDNLITMADNVVSINGHLVRVDRWVLEAALAAAERAAHDRHDAALNAVVESYAGPLLPDEAAPWVVAERRRLRLRVDAVLAKGSSHLAPVDAGTLLSRALAADAALPLVASLLQSVMLELRDSRRMARRTPRLR